jgi:hypothetical protein
MQVALWLVDQYDGVGEVLALAMKADRPREQEPLSR